jgi:hypothetical protein
MYVITQPQLAGCDPCQGVGFLPAPQIDWSKWILAAAAAMLIYLLFFSRSQRARRRELAEARARYREEVRRIKAKYPRL